MSEAGDPALIGRRVAGKFLVEKLLGGGAMGAVYRARDTSLERYIALKVLHPAMAVDPSFVNRFHREAKAASRLDHPSSMRVIEFGEEPDGLLYIAMEYLEGRDLYKVIHEDWPLPEPRIADIMMKALAAAAVAHDMGVIHRDLKPENIMILDRKDDEGNDIVKVCDFGIAKITERDDADPGGAPKTAGAKLTTAGLVVGTPEYMSPEQARGEKLDARSDLYSLGIILYQLLTGRTPFLADTALAVVLKHITEVPEPPSVVYPGVHKGLEAVAMRSLAKAKEERFQSARDMRTAIKAAIEGRPMPVDTNVSTAVDVLSDKVLAAAQLGSGPHPGVPTSPAKGGPHTTPMNVSSVAAPSEAISAGVKTNGAAASSEKSRAPLFVAVALGALVLGGVGVVFAQRDLFRARIDARPAPTSSDSLPTIRIEATPSASVSNVTPVPSASVPVDGKTAKHASPPVPKAANTRTASTPTAETPPPPPPAPEPTVAPSPPPPPPPPPPVFNAATCKASVGAPKSVSGYNAKDLALRGTDSAWTGCARSAIKERPSAPIGASVHVRFNDNRVFRGATCNGCPPALAQCIATSTAKTVSVTLKGGDATGDPAFDVPVTFSCD